ncbi:MAG: hypothetical protein DRJ01_07360 [Bacteroidetes bacterium]|nr:MAG: hypothetical protein DRJ01_07360 [Bacteroidota bacterium]
MVNKNSKQESTELTVEDKLKALYELQQVDTEINKIKILRGELPLEIQDLEDELAGLETRINNLNEEIAKFETEVKNRKNEIINAEALIEKYKSQQMNVRNNREYDSLSKEIEFQTLEIELCNKKIKEFSVSIDQNQEIVNKAKENFEERRGDLETKKSELENIVAETKIEEERLEKKAEEIESMIDERLVTAYNRIRKNARNGLAVVTVQRDACGGCFNKIPPQRQVDVRSRKKIIVCEYCGRILVDDDIAKVEE